jgi:outer membrane murein-binding lipoprotein Lpp
VDDFRRNAERQSKEQKAVGSLLAWISYSLVGAVLLVATLAGVGGWTLYRLIQKQSVTVAELDSQYKGEFAQVREQMAAEALALQSALNRSNDRLDATTNLAIKQQDTIKALLGQAERQASSLAQFQEKLAKSQEQLLITQEELKLEASRRWKGDRDSQSRDARLDSRLDALESRAARSQP